MNTTCAEDITQQLEDAAYAAASDVCQHCLRVHSLPIADENFLDSRGFSINDLPFWADAPAGPVYWDTITPETRYAEANAYLISVAADYLREGNVICECGR